MAKYRVLTRLDTVPTLYADARKGKPATVAVTAKEGGDWIEWAEYEWGKNRDRLHTVHAIKFADGSVWDAVNGWRQNT